MHALTERGVCWHLYRALHGMDTRLMAPRSARRCDCVHIARYWNCVVISDTVFWQCVWLQTTATHVSDSVGPAREYDLACQTMTHDTDGTGASHDIAAL